MEKQYWKGLEELRNDPEFEKLKNQEFAEELPLEEIFSSKAEANNTTGRRDFLKILGFGVGVATLAACEAPVRKTIPYLIKPEEIVPGVANYYASSYFDGRDYCSIIVKTREGRPIKIEGNELSPITKGGTNARVQASVLSLYDSSRLKTPLIDKGPATWNRVDKAVTDKLVALYGASKPVEEVKDKKGKVVKGGAAKGNAAAGKSGNLRILSSTIISPSTKAVIGDFINKYPGTKHITYDAVSFSGMRMANEETFGSAMIPSYRFDNAKAIVSFDADFLVNWLSPIEYSKQYVAKRKLRGSNKDASMSKHIQFETALSVTGSNADKRIAIKPSEMGSAVLSLYNKIASKAGEPTYNGSDLGKADESIKEAADELWRNKGNALVVSGSNDKNVQILVNQINQLLGSYGVTIDTTTPSNLQQGNDAEVKELIDDMNNGKVDGLILYNVNPVYTLGKAQADAFKTGCAKVSLKVTFTDREDETASIDGFIVAPDNHYLESWNDAEPKKGHVSLSQPTINPLFSTRAAQESLMIWAGIENKSYHDYIQDHWKKNFFHEGKTKEKHLMFEDFWNKSLQDGVVELTAEAAPIEKGKDKPKEVAKDNSKDKTKAAPRTANKTAEAAAGIQKSSGSGFELVVYEKTGLGNGNQANNPWLQELPDPISKVCWDNYLALSPGTAKRMNFKQGDVATVSVNGYSVDVVVLEQPGQAADTGSLAIGYGRTNAGKTSSSKTKVIGVNAYPFSQFVNGSIQYFTAADVKKTAKTYELASTQTHHTMMGRPVVKEASLEEYRKDGKAGNEQEYVVTMDGKQKPEDVDLWASKENPGHPRPNHQWGLSIDLNSCIGCGACVIACTAENNVPVVGKAEVMRSREMHWMRIDRYYSSDAKKGDLSNMEHPAEQPQVVFQPIMCQHCNHAPCETVCPVIATSHSSEGLNQMTYNRCVGTRYCANNCPYKVRRFNWFKYADNPKFDFNMNDDLGKMVLNPDVVVRSRGVMEKCSMCVQRIQETKLVAKKDKRKIKDGEIKMACSQACPTNAITFGDWNDTNSELSLQGKEERSYHLLEELDVKPNVVYQTKIRNVEEAKA